MSTSDQAANDDVKIYFDASKGKYIIQLGETEAGYAAVKFVDGDEVEPAQSGKVLDFFSTVVDPAFGGRGLGGRLVTFVMDDASRQGLAVIPTCPFVQAWTKKNPDHEVTVVNYPS